MASTKVTLRRAIKKNAEERKLIAVKLTNEIVANKRKALKNIRQANAPWSMFPEKNFSLTSSKQSFAENSGITICLCHHRIASYSSLWNKMAV